MKGQILDFNEEIKTGQILGQDGNRYSFNIDEWKSKNKSPEIDIEVDFVIKDNIATEIFSLKIKTEVEQNHNTFQNNNLNLKKINFEDIEKEMYNDKRIEDKRKETSKGFYALIAVDIIAYFFTKTGISAIAYVILFFSVPFSLFMIYPYYRLVIKKDLNPKDMAQNMIRESVIDEVYSNSLTILNYVPDNLNYHVIKMISSSSRNYDDAKKQLIRQAYELKADAILNLKDNTNSSSDVKSSYIPLTNTQQIKTNVVTTHRLEGIAIKLNS